MYSSGPPLQGRAKAGRPARSYLQEVCADTGCCLEDQSEAMDARERRERVREIRAEGATWWWWWWCISPKVNMMARLEFELTYYDVAVQHVSHLYHRNIPFPQSHPRTKVYSLKVKFPIFLRVLFSKVSRQTFSK